MVVSSAIEDLRAETRFHRARLAGGRVSRSTASTPLERRVLSQSRLRRGRKPTRTSGKRCSGVPVRQACKARGQTSGGALRC
jgi:hypothetical protein